MNRCFSALQTHVPFAILSVTGRERRLKTNDSAITCFVSQNLDSLKPLPADLLQPIHKKVVSHLVIQQAFRFRLYPNKEQEILIAKTIGCSRFVFNRFLAQWNEVFKETGKGLTYGACSSKLPALKQEYEWLKEVDSIAIQSSVKHLADAFSRMFKKQNQAPRFKSKKNPVQSYMTKCTNNNIAVVDNRLKLPFKW